MLLLNIFLPFLARGLLFADIYKLWVYKWSNVDGNIGNIIKRDLLWIVLIKKIYTFLKLLQIISHRALFIIPHFITWMNLIKDNWRGRRGTRTLLFKSECWRSTWKSLFKPISLNLTIFFLRRRDFIFFLELRNIVLFLWKYEILNWV